jgi:hypothetical protein
MKCSWYLVLIRAPVQHLAGELRTVVDDHVLRFSSLLFPPFQQVLALRARSVLAGVEENVRH